MIRRYYTLGRFLALVTATTLLAIVLLLMFTDNPQEPEPVDVRNNAPFTIDGEPGFLCDITVESNRAAADTLHADCEKR